MSKRLALFDLDHTLLPLDSDHEWGEFLVRRGAVDAHEHRRRNDDFFKQYQEGRLDPIEYLEFALGTLARFPRADLDALHADYIDEVVRPALRPQARDLVKAHQDAGDLVALVTATNRYVTAPIAAMFGIEHHIAAVPEEDAHGNLTGRLLGGHTNGPGKLRAVHDWLGQLGRPLSSFERSTMYSDSQNDIPLMSAVTHPVATNPNATLAAHARQHGWPILHLFHD